jgi:hypothetical protein
VSEERKDQILDAAVVWEGIEGGEFRYTGAAEVAVTLVSLFKGVTLLWAFDPGTVPIEGQLDISLRLHIEGLLQERT